MLSLAINPAGVWCQTSTTAGASGGDLYKNSPAIEERISRPLEIYENKYRSTEHGTWLEALGFDGYMWAPEYSDSELRAAEASGESQDELCLSTPANTGWRVVYMWPVSHRRHGQEMLLGDAWLHPDLRCLADWVDFRQVCLQPAVLTLAFASWQLNAIHYSKPDSLVITHRQNWVMWIECVIQAML